ncbi:4Fe-4S binding protein [Chloroflexota bacterium]
MPVGANLLFGEDADIWVEAAEAAEKGGADILEMNLSCPMYSTKGVYLFNDLDKTTEVIKAVRSSTGLPIMAKLHACLSSYELKQLAVTVVEAGADAISVTNIFRGLVGVDIETGIPMATEIDVSGKLRGPVSVFSGPAIKPFGLRAVAEIASVVDVPVSGVGGITNWKSAVEYMMLGATTVQVGMGAMLFGYDLVQEMVSGLRKFMERKGYQSLEDFIGISHSKVIGIGENMDFAPSDLKRRNVVDETLCNGCGLCVKGCLANARGAMQMIDGVAVIDRGLCYGCNVCRIVCPQGAIREEKEEIWIGASGA